MILGILSAPHIHSDFSFVAYISVFLLFFLFLSGYLSRKSLSGKYEAAFVFFFVSLSFLSGLLISHRTDPRNFKRHYSHYTVSGKPNLIKIRISKVLKNTSKYYNYTGEIININNINTTGKILLKASKSEKKFRPGDILLLLANQENIKEIASAGNPFVFDYKKFMSSKGIYHQINLQKTAYQIISPGNSLNPADFFEKIRAHIKKLFIKNGITGKEYQLASSLLIGERNLLDPEIVKSFQQAGTIHILAISGLHIGILLLFINFIFLPVKKKGGKKLFLLLTLTVLWLYAFITGLSPSVLRAVVMFSFFQIGLNLKRENYILNSLFASAFILILLKPSIVYEVGFQLSYAAVLGIIAFYPILSKPIQKWKKPWKWLGDLFIVSLSAQLGILPLSLYYFHQFPLFFLLANLLVIPLLFLVLFTGFALIILGSLGINFKILWEFWDLLLKLLLQINYKIAELDHSLISHIKFDFFKMFFLFIIIFLFYRLLKTRFSGKYLLYFLAAVAIFQIYGLSLKWTQRKENRLYFLKNYSQGLIAVSNGNKIKFYTNAPPADPFVVQAFKKVYKEVKTDSLPFYMPLKKFQILYIDSTGIWEFDSIKPRIVCLQQSPKINLEKLVLKYRPEKIISLSGNYPSFNEKWKKTCKDYGIKFINITETGALIMDIDE